MNLVNKKIILGITGSIAAYKSAELIRLLRQQEAQVKVVMTAAAQEFITPLTLQALSGQPVYSELLNPETEAAMNHIELARWADVILIAPASANFIANLSHGFADDLLNTLCLATTAPIWVAPAMNQQMWLNAATQNNIKCLSERGIKILGPDSGSQACGEIGFGRLLEPEKLLESLNHFFTDSQLLAGQRVIITSGPTCEAIDAVRYITNHSSGKMGYALAQAAAQSGADVLLISGPTHLTCPPGVRFHPVLTAAQMYAAVMQTISECDIFIAAAAVADYRPQQTITNKLKKTAATLILQLELNPDILAAVAALDNPPFTVGFAAETENLIANAQEKLIKKNLDLIVANLVGADCGFNREENAAVLITKQHQQISFSKTKKTLLATQLIKLIADEFRKTQTVVAKKSTKPALA